MQETLAKLHLRDGVNRQLWGLALSGSTAPGTQITSELSKVRWGGVWVGGGLVGWEEGGGGWKVAWAGGRRWRWG